MMDREPVIVAMKHEFRAMVAQDTFKVLRIGEAAPEFHTAPQRWMVDHHHAEKTLLPGSMQQGRKPVALRAAHGSGREKWGRRHTGIHPDERDIVAHTQIGVARFPIIAAHEGTEHLGHRLERSAHIGIVIARNDADMFGISEGSQVACRNREFGWVANIHEVTCQGHMIRLVGSDIGDDGVQHRYAMDGGPPAIPVDRAGQPLAGESAHGHAGQGADMGIGEMREKKTQGPDARSSAHVAEFSQPVSYDAARASRGEDEGNRLGLRHRLLMRVMHLWFRLKRGMTLGVRAIVRDEDGRVFLVRHSYVPGWHLPGGGVEAGQTARAALEMELREEGNFQLGSEPVLLGIFHNLSAWKRDHVMLYLVENAHQTAPREPDHEIVECGFFPIGALPEGTTASTRRRLAELSDGVPVSAHW